MPLSVLGGQTHSISSQGLALFQQGPIISVLGDVEIDLASAPLPPGEYRLDISTFLGGIEIYLPRNAQYSINGTSIMGGKDIHQGPENWDRLTRSFQKIASLPAQAPEIGLMSQEQPVIIRLNLNHILGGVDIYQL